jgi:ribosomal protein L11 methyltransferase
VRSWPALLCVGLDSSQGHLPPEGEGGAGITDLLHAALTDFIVAAIDEPSPDALRAYFQDPAERDRALALLRPAFPDVQFAAVDVPDEDWAARSQASLTAITVGGIIIAPPWDADRALRARAEDPGAYEAVNETTVVIQPSMGFGTGHHATTRLCLAALQRARVRGRSVIDVGTGSGVLAIAASLLGAMPVIALDDDPDAIQSARENLELNPQARVDLRTGDLRTAVPGVANVVLANLTGTLLIQAATQLRQLVAPNGRLIVSGLLDHEETAVSTAFAELPVMDRSQEDEWICLVMAPRHAFE